MEKLPKDYSQSIVQRALESIRSAITASSKKAAQDLFDTSKEIRDSIKKLADKVSDMAGEPGEQTQATFVPPPEDLSVYEFGTWGFATVNPFLRWKYRGKIVGYEFYGTMNVTFTDGDPTKPDFEPHESDYVQKGVHYPYNGSLLGQGLGTVASPNTYLNTLDPAGTSTHILDRRLWKAIASKRLILENVTTGEWGYIGGSKAVPLGILLTNPTMYRLSASWNKADPDHPETAQTYLEWREGDIWRIKEYPSQSLFTIGPLAIFYKRIGNIYVKARTIGKGHSYSNYTEAVSSTGVTSSENVPAPVIVMPVHECNPGVTRSCTLDQADNYKPRCPVCGIVEWDAIISGTREVDHWAIFGFEWSSVEFVYEELDSSYGEFTYPTKRAIAGVDGEFLDGEDVEGTVE